MTQALVNPRHRFSTQPPYSRTPRSVGRRHPLNRLAACFASELRRLELHQSHPAQLTNFFSRSSFKISASTNRSATAICAAPRVSVRSRHRRGTSTHDRWSVNLPCPLSGPLPFVLPPRVRGRVEARLGPARSRTGPAATRYFQSSICRGVQSRAGMHREVGRRELARDWRTCGDHERLGKASEWRLGDGTEEVRSVDPSWDFLSPPKSNGVVHHETERCDCALVQDILDM